MKKIYSFVFIIFFTFLFIDKVNAANKINSINMNVYIDEYGNANIEEIRDVYLDSGTEGYRIFPELGNSSINSYTVTDDSGTLYQYKDNWNTSWSFDAKTYKNGINYISNGLELCWGISKYGNRIYTLKYTITNFIDQYTDKQGINFNLLEVAQNVDEVSIKIDSYIPLSVDVVKIWGLGYNGEIVFQNGSILMTTKNFDEYDRMVLLARFEETYFITNNIVNKSFDEVYDEVFEVKNDSIGIGVGPIKKEELDKETDLIMLYIILGIPLLCYGIPAIVCILLVIVIFKIFSKKNKTDNKVYEGGNDLGNINNVNYYRDIPCDKNLFNMYYLIILYFNPKKNVETHKTYQKGIVVALIMKWILEDKIDFKNNSLIIKNKDLDIDLFDNSNYEYLERELYSYLLNVFLSNGIIEKNEFEIWCKNNYNNLIAWFDRIERNTKDFYRNKGYIQNRDIVVKKVFGKRMKTIEYFDIRMREEALKIFGFKKFLLDFGRMHEKSTVEVELWNHYLICAELFGVADKVRKELKNYYPELNIPVHIDLSSIDEFVSMGYEKMYKAKQAERTSSYSSSDSDYSSSSSRDYSGTSSSSGGGGSSYSSGGSSSRGSGSSGFR